MARVSYTFGKSLSMADEDGYVSLPYFNWSPVLGANTLRPATTHTHFTAAGIRDPVGKARSTRLRIRSRCHRRRLEAERHLRGLLRSAVHGLGQQLFSPGQWQQPGRRIRLRRSRSRRQGTWQSLLRSDELPRPAVGVRHHQGLPLWHHRPKTSFAVRLLADQPAIFKNFKSGRRSTPSSARNRPTSPIRPSGARRAAVRQVSSSIRAGSATLTLPSLQNFMCITSATAGRTFRFGLRIAF